jgi:hypothetical protein
MLSLLRLHKCVNRHARSHFNILKFVTRNFSSEKKEDNITIEVNEDNSSQLDLTIPEDLQPFYSFGSCQMLYLYENSEVLTKFRTFTPAPKFTVASFFIYAFYSFGTSTFVPSILISYYLLNKSILITYPKMTQVLLLALEENCELVYLRTYYGIYRFKISELELVTNPIKVGNEEFFEMKIKSIKLNCYLNAKANFLNFNLLSSLFTGKITKVNMLL